MCANSVGKSHVCLTGVVPKKRNLYLRMHTGIEALKNCCFLGHSALWDDLRTVCFWCRFVHLLPDVDFVVNTLDEPRVLPGSAANVEERFKSSQCQNASESFHKFRHLHGSINNP